MDSSYERCGYTSECGGPIEAPPPRERLLNV